MSELRPEALGANPLMEQDRYNAEQAYYRQAEHGQEGVGIEEILRNAETPDELLIATRDYIRSIEDVSMSNDQVKSEYPVFHTVSLMRERRSCLKKTTKDLIALGVIKKGNLSQNGVEGIASKGGFAIRTEQQETEVVVDQEKDIGGKVVKERTRMVPITISYFGTPQEREDLEEAYKKSEAEILTRRQIDEIYRFYCSNSENLGGLAKLYFVNHPTPEGFSTLFNAKDVPDSPTRIDATGAELRPEAAFGDKIDVALRLLVAVSLSEKKSEFLKLVKTPGWEYIFPKVDGNENPTQEHWVGNPSEWAEEGKRDKKTVKTELEQNKRIGITKYGNVFVEGKMSQINEVRGEIRDILGGDVSAKDAEEVAYRLFKLWMMADENGWEKYAVFKDETRGEIVGQKLHCDLGNPTTSDFVKVVRPGVYQTVYKEKPGHPNDAGPLSTTGKYERFAVSILRGITTGEGNEKRSFWEKWWGYPEAEIGGKKLLRENANRLRELPWLEKSPKFLNSAYLPLFMAGRTGDIGSGTFDFVMKTDWHPDNFLDGQWWGKFAKLLRVGITEAVAVNGQFRNRDPITVETHTLKYRDGIISTFWDGVRKLPQNFSWKWETIKGARVHWNDPNNRHELYITDEIVRAAGEYGVKLTPDNRKIGTMNSNPKA